MSEWVECNLPWSVELEGIDLPKCPDMDDKVKAHFGYTIEELERELFPGYEYCCEHPFFEENGKIRDDLEEKYPNNWQELRDASDNIAVKTVSAWAKARKEIDEWVSVQPEVIAWVDEQDRLYDERDEKYRKLCFSGLGLNKPGTLIECKDGDEISYKVIGHINKLGGSCDDCIGISDDAVIVRYKVLWSDGQTDQSAAE